MEPKLILHLPADDHSEERLIESLKIKDQQAFNYLYDNYSAALYGIILKIIGPGETANDLLQEVFIKIWRNIDSYDTNKGRLYTWMLNIARNTAIDMLRSSAFQQQNKNLDLENNRDKIKGNLSNIIPIEHLGLKEIVQRLDEKHKLIIELAYFKGYTHEEIAKTLNIPLGTVKTRCRKALAELKNLMK